VSEEIVVLDDFLPRQMYDTLARFISTEPLAYGSRSNFKTDPHGHWSRDFVAAGPHNLADVADLLETQAGVAPVHAAWNFVRDAHLPEYLLVRCYLNGYTYGTDGYFHTDSERPDEWTSIIYVNDYWEPDWAGETVFLGASADIAKAVLPRPNRAVIFPSSTQHAGRAVSRKCTILRKTLIFKARKRRGDDFEKLSFFLRKAGAAGRRHQTGTLHDHLVRTFSIMQAKGLDLSVCFAGGLHAIYGTNAIGPGILTRDEQAEVVSQFGQYAEELAYLFSVLERPGTLELPLAVDAQTALVRLANGDTVELPRGTFDDLRQIECANLIDQGTLARQRILAALWRAGEP